MIVSTIGCIIAGLITKPESVEILVEFYTRVRAWGFWKPVYEKAVKINPAIEKNTDFYRDWFNIIIGIIWQMSLVAIPMYLVIQDMSALGIGTGVLLITSYILKKSWYDKLKKKTI
ncbi:MAG: hypothetical protein JXR46_05670 [Calditrichaceae bacterium]|nr:hypothetical protein [Calditrichaceae bacterium]MBN2708515.1 hypothetical protein [Calditrichaceae bacterium]RQV95440.1 MAG: hypothetical protein EH224_07415 [Calditrichota bacterium]